jgi:type III restriction enzyme
MDQPATVHAINVLTVVASESYKDFVTGLQRDISDTLSDRPRVADEVYFTGKVLSGPDGNVEVTPQLAIADPGGTA